MRVVLDTSVLVAGLRSRRGASNLVLVAVAEVRCVPLVSTAMFLEYEAVLLRAEQRLATGMSAPDINAFLAAFASAAEPVEINFRWRPQLRDPADEMVLETAANGKAATSGRNSERATAAGATCGQRKIELRAEEDSRPESERASSESTQDRMNEAL